MIRSLALVAAALAACSATSRPTPPAAAELTHTTYSIAGNAPAGLVVALHYSGGTPAMWDELVADWGAPVRVVFPQGPFPHPEVGFTWFPRDHERKDAAAKTADVERSAARVARLIRALRAQHPEIRRVAVTGFSYGGDLAWMLAIRYPDLVHIAVPMGTRLLGDPMAPLPATNRVLVLQGETDAIIDARSTAARVEELKRRAVPIELETYPGLGHDLSPALVADWRAYLRRALE